MPRTVTLAFALATIAACLCLLQMDCVESHNETRWAEKNRHDECMAAIGKDPGKANTICRGYGR